MDGSRECFCFFSRGILDSLVIRKELEIVGVGAGDTFKTGCIYGSLAGMDEDGLVRFASACSAIVISRFPLPLFPLTLEEVNELIHNQLK